MLRVWTSDPLFIGSWFLVKLLIDSVEPSRTVSNVSEAVESFPIEIDKRTKQFAMRTSSTSLFAAFRRSQDDRQANAAFCHICGANYRTSSARRSTAEFIARLASVEEADERLGGPLVDTDFSRQPNGKLREAMFLLFRAHNTR